MKKALSVMIFLMAFLVPTQAQATGPQIEEIQLACVRPVYIITDDFNRDGYPDLAVACHSCDAIAVIRNGRGSCPSVFDAPVYWGLDDSPAALASGTFLDQPGTVFFELDWNRFCTLLSSITAKTPVPNLLRGAFTRNNLPLPAEAHILKVDTEWQIVVDGQLLYVIRRDGQKLQISVPNFPYTTVFPNITFVTQFGPGVGRFSPLDPTDTTFMGFRGGNLDTDALQGFATLTHLVLDDVNNDGAVDLIVLDGLTPQIAVYSGDRADLTPVIGPNSSLPGDTAPTQRWSITDVNVQPTVELAYGFTRASFIVSADFDRDGWKDLAVAVGGNIVFYANRNGNFGPEAASVLRNLGAGITGMAVADFNRDGYPDIAAVDPQFNALIIVWNKGCWQFDYERIKKDGGPYFVSVFDCDRNGLPDLAIAERDADRVEIVLAQLVGTDGVLGGVRPDRCTRFAERYDPDSPAELTDRVVFRRAFDIPVKPGGRPVGLAVGDYDRNGMQDIAVVLGGADGTTGPNSSPEVQVIYNPCCCPVCDGEDVPIPCCEDGLEEEPAEKECGGGDTKKAP